jgi:hypothetical protein
MCSACSKYGERGTHIGFRWESQNERDHQESLEIDGIFEETVGWDSMDWTHLTQDMAQWRTLVYRAIRYWEILEYLI